MEGIGGNAWWEGYKHNCVDMVSRDLFVIKQKVAFFFYFSIRWGWGVINKQHHLLTFLGGSVLDGAFVLAESCASASIAPKFPSLFPSQP